MGKFNDLAKKLFVNMELVKAVTLEEYNEKNNTAHTEESLAEIYKNRTEDGRFILASFVLNQDFTKADYNKLSAYMRIGINTIGLSDMYSDNFEKLFSKIFKKINAYDLEWDADDFDLQPVQSLFSAAEFFIIYLEESLTELKKK